MNKACFFDRDGVLIEEEHYISDPDKVRLCKYVPDAIRLMRDNGYKIIVVSNQSGIARGYFTREQLRAVEERIGTLLEKENASIDGVYYCFHHKKGSLTEYAIDCECRKPAPGMLLEAARDFHLDLSQSFIIGDKTSDIQAGINAGCRAQALVRTGHGSEQDITPYPDAVDAPDIMTAVKKLLEKTA